VHTQERGREGAVREKAGTLRDAACCNVPMLLLLLLSSIACPLLGAAPRPPAPNGQTPMKEGRDVAEPRRTTGPVFVVQQVRPFPNASFSCASEDAMFRLPAQKGLQLSLSNAVRLGTFSRACLSEVLERALLSHPVDVFTALLRHGATPMRAHAALIALPYACDVWGLHLKEKNAHDLASRRRALWEALVKAEPSALTEEEQKEWLKNITLCFAEYWMGEYQDLWVDLDAGASPLEEDAPHRRWAALHVNADGTPIKEGDWQMMGVRKPTEDELHRAAHTGRDYL